MILLSAETLEAAVEEDVRRTSHDGSTGGNGGRRLYLVLTLRRRLMARYDVMVEIHEELLKLSGTVEQTKAHFRKPSAPTRKLPPSISGRLVVDRDRAMCALLAKAIHTAKAIRHLCDGGFSGDAHALGRAP